MPPRRVWGEGVFHSHDAREEIFHPRQVKHKLDVATTGTGDNAEAHSAGEALDRLARAVDQHDALAEVVRERPVGAQRQEFQRGLVQRDAAACDGRADGFADRPAGARVAIVVIRQLQSILSQDIGERVATRSGGVGEDTFKFDEDGLEDATRHAATRSGSIWRVGSIQKVDGVDDAHRALRTQKSGADLHQTTGVSRGDERGAALTDTGELWHEHGI